MAHAINWFDIPVNDFNRAKNFYEAILGAPMIIPMAEMTYAMFPCDMQNGEIGGGILQEPGYSPSETGTMVYLNGGEDLSVPLARVEPAGGKIIMTKTAIGNNGFMARFRDTEGNVVAFHSMK